MHPLLFREFLLELGAFISLEDISGELPPYKEDVIAVPMDPPLRSAYEKLEEDIKSAIREHPGNHSVISVGMNALLLYPDRPFGLGKLVGYNYDPETHDASHSSFPSRATSISALSRRKSGVLSPKSELS